MRFEIHQCPLCYKGMRSKFAHGVTTYYCPAEETSHYEVETDGKQTIQHMYAHPYAVDNFIGSSKSRVYKWNDTRWKFVKEVAEIKSCLQSKLFSYLKSTVSSTEIARVTL